MNECNNCKKHTETLSCDRCLGSFCIDCRINHSLFKLHCSKCYEILFAGIDWIDALLSRSGSLK